jgi:hypothetical protein
MEDAAPDFAEEFQPLLQDRQARRDLAIIWHRGPPSRFQLWD